MKLTEEELSREIKDCAKYLREKAVRDVRYGRVRLTYQDIESAGIRDVALYDYASLVEEIRSISEKLKSAGERLDKLSAHFTFFRLEPYSDIDVEIEQARNHAVDAQVQLGLAINQMEGTRPQKNSTAMPLQKSAVRLAHALLGTSQPKRVREIARRIISEAGLEPPSERAMTAWVNEIRREDK